MGTLDTTTCCAASISSTGAFDYRVVNEIQARALDCLSVFPMNAIFLSNNVLAHSLGRVMRQPYAC